MKKLNTYTLLFSLLFFGLRSQSTFQLTNQTGNPGIVPNNSIFYRSTAGGATVEHNFEVKNISASTQVISVRKTELLLNTVSTTDIAEAYFCTGVNCYDPTVGSASMTLAPNESMVFKADLEEASIAGLSEVSYKLSNGGESITLVMKYNNPASIRSNTGLFSSVSAVYPNPCTSKSYMNISSAQDMEGATLTILNSLGAVVSSKHVSIITGKNTINVIDAENLNSGIYFVSLAYGNSIVTKKITIIN
jgi:hypothetical protein